jgi:hypothetical protein
MTEMYKWTRPSASQIVGEEEVVDEEPAGGQIIGEVEVRGPMKADDSLVVRARDMPGYKVGTLDEARAKFAKVRKVADSWLPKQ